MFITSPQEPDLYTDPTISKIILLVLGSSGCYSIPHLWTRMATRMLPAFYYRPGRDEPLLSATVVPARDEVVADHAERQPLPRVRDRQTATAEEHFVGLYTTELGIWHLMWYLVERLAA
ncbi:hypothetical protein F4810DRAFT_709515 [Camillea tinctor]|nr:hypothetical protein F4810DRAFT_709515 [Camillea tinctor]